MSQIKALNDLKPHDKGKVIKVSGSGSTHRRILDMGIVKNVEIEVERIAPLGDPMEIMVKGYHLSLRKKEADKIFVEPIR